MDHTHLLISFCNQSTSPNHSLCVIDPQSKESNWIDITGIPEELRQDFSGIAGICKSGENIFIATQGSKPSITCISLSTLEVISFLHLHKCKDSHSMVFHENCIYLASTGTNEVYRIPFTNNYLSNEELFWSYPNVSHEKDEIHLNGLSIHRGQLIASCFGPKNSENSWGSNGRVFYLATNENIVEGLKQPHSPVVIDDRLIFAESAKQKVYVLENNKNEWIKRLDLKLKGYARGIAVVNQSIFIGISADRSISRSTKQILPANQQVIANASLIEIDLISGEQLQDLSLQGYGREPYDILAIEPASTLCTEMETIYRRVSEIELFADRYAADAGRLYLEKTELLRNDADLVSIIIPTYNRAEFIGEAIVSVLSQTYSNIELIVIDDGSTDNTQLIVSKITDKRLTYIKQNNRGRSNARNHALSLASGKYITFLDSDDLYLPNKIELQVSYLKNHPGVGMIYTSAHCINTYGRLLDHKYIASVSGLIYQSIAFFTPVTITLPTVMTYKSVLDQVGGFDEDMDRFEDTDMWRRISKRYRIDAMPDFTCLLRTHEDNSLQSQDPHKISSALDYYANKISTEDTEVDLTVRNKGLSGLYTYYAYAFLSVPQFAESGKRLIKTAKNYQGLDLSFSRLLQKQSIKSIYYRIYYKTKLDSLTFWGRWTLRFIYFRSANFGYKLLVKARRLFKNY
nr:glycosyltransferase [Methylophilus sp. QUAN]